MFRGKHYLDQEVLNKRIELSEKLRKQYPDHIPAIVKRSSKENYLDKMSNEQFLIPNYMTVGAFVNFLTNRLRIHSIYSIWIYSDGNVLSNRTQRISEIYDQYVSMDGFLYLTYRSEESFG